MSTTTRSLQFAGDGDIEVDASGHPVYGRPPTGDLVLAMGVTLGTYHADPDLGSEVPNLVRGEPRTKAEIKNAIEVGLQRLEDVGTLLVEDVLVFETTADVFTTATDQPFKVRL